MAQRNRERLMKTTAERKLKKRWSFFDRVLRGRDSTERFIPRPVTRS